MSKQAEDDKKYNEFIQGLLANKTPPGFDKIFGKPKQVKK